MIMATINMAAGERIKRLLGAYQDNHDISVVFKAYSDVGPKIL